MSLERKNIARKKRRVLRVRAKITSLLPRVSVFRSANHMYAQLIDDNGGQTLLSSSSLQLKKVAGDKKAVAFAVGKELAKNMISKGMSAAVFDRGGFLYHGRVKAVAEGLRDGGIKI